VIVPVDVWKQVPLKDAGRWLSGGTPSTTNPAYWHGDIPWISSGSLTSFRLSHSDRRLTKLGTQNGTRVVPKGTILIVVRGMSLKTEVRLGIAQRSIAFGQDCKALEASPDFVPEFLAYALAAKHSALLALVDEAGHGTGRLNSDQLFAVTVPCPSKPEQLAISGVLSAIDDKIESNARSIDGSYALADALASSILRAFSEAGRNAAPRIRLGALGKLFDGPHATPTRRGDGPYFLNIASLRRGRLDLKESDHVSDLDYAKWTRRVTPRDGDLLFSYETRLGEAALMPAGVRACLGRRMALLRPDPARVDPHFLLHFYLGADFQRTIAERTIHGATVPRIGLATMGDWEVSIPPLDEQRSIAPQLEALHSAAWNMGRQSERLAATRDELLPLLMSGKITVKTAESLVEEVV
jgi:hypothetical protein